MPELIDKTNKCVTNKSIEKYDWTRVYRDWEEWEKNEDLADNAASSVKKTSLSDCQKMNPCCAHDHSAETRIMNLSEEEKIIKCENLRKNGNDFFVEGQYHRAVTQYRQAIAYYDYAFPSSDEQQWQLDDIQKNCHLNCAACYLKTGKLAEALEYCNVVLMAEPDNIKALFRRAQAHRLRDDFVNASSDLSAALRMSPRDAVLHNELLLLTAQKSSYITKSKFQGKKMIQTVECSEPNPNINSLELNLFRDAVPGVDSPQNKNDLFDLYKPHVPSRALSLLDSFCKVLPPM